MKNTTQQRVGVLALVLLASAFSTTNVSAKHRASDVLEGLDLQTSTLLSIRDNLELWGQQKTLKLSVPSREGYEAISKPVLEKAMADEDLEAVEAPSWKQRASAIAKDVAWQLTPQAVRDGYTQTQTDIRTLQGQGYGSLYIGIRTFAQPFRWFGNQLVSKDTKATSYFNLHNLAASFWKGATKCSKIIDEADGEELLRPALGAVGAVTLGSAWLATTIVAHAGHGISYFGGRVLGTNPPLAAPAQGVPVAAAPAA